MGEAPAADRPFLLVHGTATTASIWEDVRRELVRRELVGQRFRIRTPDRPSTGDLAREVAALRPEADGAVFGGVSGGATLGLAMLAAGVPLAAAVLHEPAVGSLLPGLLGPVAQAYATGGVASFGHALYGPRWQPHHAPADSEAVARDLVMFLEFEPARPVGYLGRAVITVGENSPPIRHEAAAVLHREFGLPVRVLPGCAHAAHLEAPAAFAAVLLDVAAAADRRTCDDVR